MTIPNKQLMTEQDICTKFVVPALEAAGWNIMTQVREQYFFTDGRIMAKGKTVKRGERKRADFLLNYKPNIPLAIIEAKDNNHSVGAGMQQGLAYAETLDIPFVFSTNGDGFLFRNRLVKNGTVETNLALDEFPSPADLWNLYCQHKGITPQSESVVTFDYYSDGSGRTPRYYQLIAINRTIEQIALGQKRVLLVMATGTGKTMTAFQIIWRLWKSGAAKRILFLADRNILVDQTKTNDFKPFGAAMTKITKRTINKAFEIYLSLYQAVSGNEDASNIYKQFTPDFFDLVVIDECHRGSAADDSNWKDILKYFSNATQIGLTATPKETEDTSNTNYFGEAIYTYSLKQGIEDGFLAPYRVIRIDFDKDLTGWRPELGKVDKHGEEIEDRVYNQKDFDRTLVLDKRTELVARKVTEFLKATNRMDKTIVFCDDIDHAERMRQALVNQNADMVQKNSKYVMRITGDSDEGKDALDPFITPSEPYPVIVTTSELMTTGVDAKTCKLIVLDKNIKSMTKFKQIIGRGTRIDEDYGKMFFTIMDFKKATELFADPDFDGPAEIVYIPKPDDPIVPPEASEPGDGTETESVDINSDGEDFPGLGDGTETTDGTPIPGDGDWDKYPDGDKPKRKKYHVGDVDVFIVAERVQYYGNDGKLITESLRDYTRKAVLKEFSTLNVFLQKWTSAEQKLAILAELQSHGILLDELADEVGKDLDPFDLICHVAFDQPPLTRKERANNVKKRNYFGKYSETARKVLEALLDKYADAGIDSIEDLGILRIFPLSTFGTPVEIIKLFGGKDQFLVALQELEAALYAVA